MFTYKYNIAIVCFFRYYLVPLFGLSVVVHYISQRLLGIAVAVVAIFVCAYVYCACTVGQN